MFNFEITQLLSMATAEIRPNFYNTAGENGWSQRMGVRGTHSDSCPTSHSLLIASIWLDKYLHLST